jgi:DNA-directed RNA polymerase subunit M/transcription elongation factor TFIIS
MIPKTCKHCGGNVSEERDIGTSYFACDKCGHSYGSKQNNVKPGKHLKKGDDDLYYSVKKRIQLKPAKTYVTTPKIYNKKAFVGNVDDLFKSDKTPKFKRTQPTTKKRTCKK